MNRTDIIEEMCMSEKGLTKAAAGRLLNRVLDTIAKTVAEGEIVTLPGFGSFVAVETAPRQGRNVSTGEPINIPASKRPKFRPGQKFKDMVSGR